MNNRMITPLFGVIFLLLLIAYFFKVNSVTTITYFPIDTKANFNYAKTELKLTVDENENPYRITWTSDSQTNNKLYLRQDVSLLYDRGVLRGVRSKWIENTDIIAFQEDIYEKESSLFQSISYHHGEIHFPDDKIKSVQLMSEDHLYVVDNPNSTKSGFKTSKLKWEKTEKEELDLLTKKQLLSHWNMLINHFNVNTENYISVPLNELYKFNHERIPSHTTEQTNKIIGQLWEGLYKNYIIPITNTKSDNFNNLIPLILFNKDNTHLIVLFELNGKREKLIQKYTN